MRSRRALRNRQARRLLLMACRQTMIDWTNDKHYYQQQQNNINDSVISMLERRPFLHYFFTFHYTLFSMGTIRIIRIRQEILLAQVQETATSRIKAFLFGIMDISYYIGITFLLLHLLFNLLCWILTLPCCFYRLFG